MATLIASPPKKLTALVFHITNIFSVSTQVQALRCQHPCGCLLSERGRWSSKEQQTSEQVNAVTCPDLNHDRVGLDHRGATKKNSGIPSGWLSGSGKDSNRRQFQGGSLKNDGGSGAGLEGGVHSVEEGAAQSEACSPGEYVWGTNAQSMWGQR